LIAKFEQTHPEIAIKVSYVAVTGIISQERTQLLAGTAPDIIETTPGTGTGVGTQDFAHKHTIVPLTGAWTQTLPSFASGVNLGGQTYGLPLDVTLSSPAINLTLMKKLKITVPTTFPAVLTLCRQVKQAGYIPFQVPGGEVPYGATSITGPMLASTEAAAPSFFAARTAGKTTFASSSPWLQAFQQVIEMKNAGCFEPNPGATQANDSIKSFSQGHALMIGLGGAITVPEIYQANSHLDLEEIPWPGPTQADTHITLTIPNALAINTQAGNTQQKAAAEFIDYAAQPTVASSYGRALGRIGLWDLSDNRDISPILTPLLPFYKAGKDYANINLLFNNPTGLPTYGQCSQGLLTGQVSPQGCLKMLDASWDQGKSG
jgi:raffinose/stachyose/melibiose transport system substrate-binding protein